MVRIHSSFLLIFVVVLVIATVVSSARPAVAKWMSTIGGMTHQERDHHNPYLHPPHWARRS